MAEVGALFDLGTIGNFFDRVGYSSVCWGYNTVQYRIQLTFRPVSVPRTSIGRALIHSIPSVRKTLRTISIDAVRWRNSWSGTWLRPMLRRSGHMQNSSIDPGRECGQHCEVERRQPIRPHRMGVLLRVHDQHSDGLTFVRAVPCLFMIGLRPTFQCCPLPRHGPLFLHFCFYSWFLLF